MFFVKAVGFTLKIAFLAVNILYDVYIILNILFTLFLIISVTEFNIRMDDKLNTL